jgi:hypothetical protein
VDVAGGIDETLPVTLRGTPSLVEFTTAGEPHADVEKLHGTARFSERGTAGGFTFPGNINLSWPSPRSICAGTWLFAPDEGEPSAQDFVDWTASLPPLSFEQQDAKQYSSGSPGTPLEGSITFSSAFDYVCWYPGFEPESSSMQFEGTVELVEGNHSYTRPVWVETEFDARGKALRLSYQCLASPDEFEQACGDFGVDLSGYDRGEEILEILIYERADGTPIAESSHFVLGEHCPMGDCMSSDMLLSTTFGGRVDGYSYWNRPPL